MSIKNGQQQPTTNDMTAPPAPITLLGTPVHPITMVSTLAAIRQFMSEPRLHQICTTNPEFVMTAQRDPLFRQILEAADLCIPDGIGLIYASRWLNWRWQQPRLPERVPGSELIYHLAALCAAEGWLPFLLGASEGIAAATADILQGQYPALQIAGTHAGSPAFEENDALVQMINESGANLLLVAYGAPKQDKWIYRNRDKLPNVRVAIGVGGSFDFVTGKSIRAPRWVQNLGLEWLHRLLHEPWRWRRMLALPQFALRVLIARHR
ncbi:MAG: WecB/TagA/CpsF family glycosyltransferase [Anaerolineales bacterium]|nr:WecB/TagA/CpsF family glycosyltransferase [Anaerolineales bacterium]